MANRYWVGGSATWNATAGSKWSLTDGGAGGEAVPTSSDDVFFTATSGAVTITLGAIATAKTFTCTGFTGTFAMSTFSMNLAGDITLVSTMALTGTSAIGFSLGTACNVTTGGLTIPVVFTFGNSLTFTLMDDFNTTSNIRHGSTTFNGNNINLLTNSNFLDVVNNTTCLGTTVINILGSNVSIGANTTSINSGIAMDIVVNSSGIVTFRQDSNANGGAFGFGGTKTFTYTAGTLVYNCAYFRSVLGGTYTFNMTGQSIPGLNLAVATTINLSSALNITGTFTLLNVDTTITGTGSLTCNTLSLTTSLTANRALTLQSSSVYNITNSFIITGPTNSFRYTLKSSIPGTKAIFTLVNGGTQNIGYTNATDIDSSLGQTIYSFNGVITTTFNWNTLTRPQQKSYIF